MRMKKTLMGTIVTVGFIFLQFSDNFLKNDLLSPKSTISESSTIQELREKYGSALRSLREDRNLKQKDLATFLNVNPVTVGDYERGVSLPRPDKHQKLIEFFGTADIGGITYQDIVDTRIANTGEKKSSRIQYGKELKLLRKGKELTQRKLADFLDINQVTVTDYESGKSSPLPFRHNMLLDILEVGSIGGLGRVLEQKTTDPKPPILGNQQLYGSAIKTMRTKKNISVEKIANAIGVDSELYIQYEEGTLIPSLEIHEAMLDFFEVNENIRTMIAVFPVLEKHRGTSDAMSKSHYDPIGITELRKQYGNALKELRKKRDLTKKDVASRLEVNPVTIGDYERGKTLPRLKNHILLLDLLGVEEIGGVSRTGLPEMKIAMQRTRNEMKKSIRQQYGNSLKGLRVAKKKLQSDMANFLEIHVVSYGDFERGKSMPSLAHHNMLLNFFGIAEIGGFGNDRVQIKDILMSKPLEQAL